MDAMVLQLDTDPTARARAQLELFKGWKARADGALVVQQQKSGAASVDASVPRCASADRKFNALMEGRLCVLFGQDYHKDAALPKDQPWVTVAAVTRTVEDTPAASDTFRFTRPRPGTTLQLPVRQWSVPVRESFKRPRHGLDVDGPNTADLCCKKRRLRSKLITSRLSQPYSQPATHILNREGQKQGDKRFLKMATSIDVARRYAHPQSTSIFKYSVMNRLRQRLGLGKPTAQQDDDGDDATSHEQGDTGTRAPWKTAGSQASSEASSSSSSSPPPRPHARPHRAAAIRPLGSGTPPRRQSARFSKPAALPLPPSDLAATKARTSPRIHPVRSPELRPDKGAYEELEEDGFAFLHGDDENNDLTDDPDHVYSDFGVIFGGGSSSSGGGSNGAGPSGGGGGSAEEDDYSYEEYLDELDGISWVTM